MVENEEIFKKDLIDEKQILPSFINEKYLKRKFKDSSKVLKEQLSDDLNNNKIIVKNKKLTIIEIDRTKKIENKIYESDDFTEVIKKLTKIVIEEDNFKFKLIKNMKNGIFIIESKDIVIYGAFFFIKYNKSKKDIEIISETQNRKIRFITEYSDGNFAYNSYIHRPMCYEDTFYVFDVNKNEEYFLKSFADYDGIYKSKFAFLTNGFIFNNFFCYNENNETSYLNIVEGLHLKTYIINFIGDIKQLVYDDKYIYLLSENDSVYIFNIENKKFYSSVFKIRCHIKEPKQIESDEDEDEDEEKKKKCNIF